MRAYILGQCVRINYDIIMIARQPRLAVYNSVIPTSYSFLISVVVQASM